MYFSCKISHSILTYLEREGRDTGFVYDWPDVPHEFLRDPSYWLEADKMEAFLAEVIRYSANHTELDRVLEDSGHNCHQLHVWGVLDSVLKIMQDPRDVWMQPEKFLSYFIAPAPPVDNFVSTQDQLELDVPVSSEQFPHSVSFLKSAFESLPCYVGKAPAVVTWQGFRVKVCWTEDQVSLFPDEGVGHNISPELMRSIVGELEAGQRALENRNRELLEKNQELLSAKEQLESLLQGQGAPEKSEEKNLVGESVVFGQEPLRDLEINVLKLKDYFVRAQQLVTLLLAQTDNKKLVQEIIRRVDWDSVQGQFPEVYGDVSQNIVKLQGFLENHPEVPFVNKKSDKFKSKAVRAQIEWTI